MLQATGIEIERQARPTYCATKGTEMIGSFRNKLIFIIFMATTFATYAKTTPCAKLLNEDAVNACLRSELSQADKELHQSYLSFHEKLTDSNRDLLKETEAAWLKSRESDCEFEAASVTGGSAYQSIYLSCVTIRTRLRIKQIIDWRKQFPMR